MALILVLLLLALLLALYLRMMAYAGALRAVVHGIEKAEPTIARAVKKHVRQASLFRGVDEFLHRIVRQEFPHKEV